MRLRVELSGENRALAVAELDSVLEAMAGRRAKEDPAGPSGPVTEVELPGPTEARDLVRRMALLRRGSLLWEPIGLEALVPALEASARSTAGSFSLTWSGEEPPGPESVRAALVEALRRGGGELDLRRPRRRLELIGRTRESLRLAEALPREDAAGFERRRMPRLPFQRPVSLPPKLARAAVNLAGIGPGSRVADPFLGTGALLLEAGLLGARLFGADRDATMVRGAIRNLAAFGLHAERLVVADAEAAPAARPWPEVDAIVTDPPYGRASSSGGESPEALLHRTLPAWAEGVRPGGRIVLVVPGGEDPLPPPWQRRVCVPHRVHRSLTREFRVYRRAGQ